MTLPRTSLGLAAGLLVVAALAWQRGGDVGMGIGLGYALGAFLAGVAVAWQAHWLRVQPARATRAQMEGFVIKLVSAALFTMILRYVPALAENVSWRAFLIAYCAPAVLVLPLATWDLSRFLARNASTIAARETTRRTA
ncbi:MAG: hypothetical protein ABI054_11280 [Planctomycetota bacterium]